MFCDIIWAVNSGQMPKCHHNLWSVMRYRSTSFYALDFFTNRPENGAGIIHHSAQIWPDALKSHNHDDTAYDTAANVPRKSLLKNQKSKTFRPQYLVPIVHKILHSYYQFWTSPFSLSMYLTASFFATLNLVEKTGSQHSQHCMFYMLLSFSLRLFSDFLPWLSAVSEEKPPRADIAEVVSLFYSRLVVYSLHTNKTHCSKQLEANPTRLNCQHFKSATHEQRLKLDLY